MSEETYAVIKMSLLLDEYWWEVRETNGRLYAWGYNIDPKQAKADATKKAKELRP